MCVCVVQVTRVVFSSSDGSKTPRAIAVEISNDENAPRFFVSVKREVVVCAGAVNTPHLLNLSGIGAKSELERVGVKVVSTERR